MKEAHHHDTVMTLVRFSLFGGGGGKNDNELGT